MIIARAVSLTLLLAATGVPMLARADSPAPVVDDATNKRADELTTRGNELATKSKWAEAEVFFRKAWALKHSYDIGGNLGITELALGKHRDAAEHLSFALRSFPTSGKLTHRALLPRVAREGEAERRDGDRGG